MCVCMCVCVCVCVCVQGQMDGGKAKAFPDSSPIIYNDSVSND